MDLGFEGNFKIHKQSINKFIHPNSIESSQKNNNWVNLIPTSFETPFANDIRPRAKSAWVSYFKSEGIENADKIFHLASIVDLVKKSKNGQKNLFGNKIDVITGGFSSQDLSVARKRRGGHLKTILVRKLRILPILQKRIGERLIYG